MKRSFKKMIAVLCAIAMVVTSVTVYNTQTAVASANATANGKVYTVTDGTNEGFTGFTCNGMEIFNETDGHIGFAWGEKVDSESIKVSINDAEVTTYNATANGIFVNYSQFKDFADGEYPILVTATTSGETAKDVKGNATLKIQDQGETEPAVTDPSAVKWDDISRLGNETTDQGNLDKFKAYVSPANPKKLEVINIQTKNDVNALYMPNNDSLADKIEVNGADVTSDCITDGAQTFVPVSLLTKMYNSVVIATVNSNELSAFIFNKAGEGGDTPVDPETTPGNVETTPGDEETTPVDVETTPGDEETTPVDVETTPGDEETTPVDVETTPGDEETTPVDVETTPGDEETTPGDVETTPTPADIVLDQELAAPADDNNYQVGGYNVYVGKWNGSTAVAGIDAADKNHIKIQQKTCQNWDPWGIQVGKKVAGLTPGETYTYTVEMKASPVDGNYKKTGDDTLYPLQAEQTVEIQVTATEDGAADFVIGLGGVGLAVVVDINNPILKDSKGNVVDMDKTGDVETTPDAVETTTPDAAETTTPSVVETTTQASATTEAPKTTTAAPKVTTKKALGKTTVKSASKKKAATKVKLTFKKVKGAKKYQVQISKTKKFKKVLVKKTVKKVKVTIKSKKVKNQKKLYVRVRAVGAKKWSKAKKIKIKK